MKERYTKLFAPEKNLYCCNSPVIICAGALLRDNYTKNMLAQFRFRNIGSKTIRTLTVSIELLDTASAPIGEALEYKYLDLNAARDEDFGMKSAVMLSNQSVRSFRAYVKELLFDDGSSWCWDGAEWEALKPFRTLEEALGDVELANQYQVRYGTDCIYEPMEDKDIWLCTCGAVNPASSRSCHACRRVYTALKDVNLNSLRQECSDRLKFEDEQHEETQVQARLKKSKRIKLAAVIVPLLFVALILAAYLPGALRRSKAYDEAGELLAAGEFQQAGQAYLALGDYKDSALKAEKEVPYRRALLIKDYADKGSDEGLKLIDVARSSLGEEANVAVILYEAAAEQFAALGNYKDSSELSEQCMALASELDEGDRKAAYDAAAELLKEEKFCEARDAFLALGSYRDSADRARGAIYAKALSLMSFMEDHDIRNVYALFSTDTETASLISFSQELALSRGEGFVTDFKAACGRDKADFLLEDSPGKELLPFPQALAELFESLGNYSDAESCVDKVYELADYTRDFFVLVEQGDVNAAYDWLTAYEDEFPDREEWLELLELYKPFCDSWSLNGGDSKLLSISAGVDAPSTSFSSVVIIGEESVTLRFTVTAQEEFTVDFTAARGDTSFSIGTDVENVGYYANVTHLDRLAIMKYSNGNMVSSCDYTRE